MGNSSFTLKVGNSYTIYLKLFIFYTYTQKIFKIFFDVYLKFFY